MSIPTQKEYEDMLIARHGESLHKKLKQAKVVVCGLGGLGSNIAISLARVGIGKLHLIDFDKVDLSNIHRQQYTLEQIGVEKTVAMKDTLSKIAPYSEITTDTVRITEDNILDLIGDADVVCEAFDNPEAKALLVNTVLEKCPDKYMVAASGMAGISSGNSIKTRKITNRFYLCGDGTSEVSKEESLVSARVMICAAHEAHMVVRILAGEYEV